MVEKNVKIAKSPKEEKEGMQDLDDLNFEIEKESKSNEDGEYEFSNRISLNHHSYHKGNFYKEYSALCTDLK